MGGLAVVFGTGGLYLTAGVHSAAGNALRLHSLLLAGFLLELALLFALQGGLADLAAGRRGEARTPDRERRLRLLGIGLSAIAFAVLAVVVAGLPAPEEVGAIGRLSREVASRLADRASDVLSVGLALANAVFLLGLLALAGSLRRQPRSDGSTTGIRRIDSSVRSAPPGP